MTFMLPDGKLHLMQLIGLSGASGSGKTTVAGMLAAELLDRGYTVKLDAFATPIKKRLIHLKKKRNAPAVIDKDADREAMQDTGSAVRSADPDYYVKCLGSSNCIDGKENDFLPEPADFLIVADVRYPNEAEFIKARGVLIHVCGCRRPLHGVAAGHESESRFVELYSGASYAIAEQPSLERLAAAVKDLVTQGRHIKNNPAEA